MNLQTTPERILIVQLMDGRRSRYIPPRRGKWQSLPHQIEMVRRIGAKPLYAIRAIPKPIPATGAEIISITDHDVIKSPGDW